MPDVTPSPAYDLDAVRRRIPILAMRVPMNARSQGPQCDATRAAAEAYLASWAADAMDWDRWMAEVEAARASSPRWWVAPRRTSPWPRRSRRPRRAWPAGSTTRVRGAGWS